MPGSTLQQIREREAPRRITSIGCSWWWGTMKPMFSSVPLVGSKSSRRVHASCCSTLHHSWSQLANSHERPSLGPESQRWNHCPAPTKLLGLNSTICIQLLIFPLTEPAPPQHSFMLTTCSSVKFTPICRREAPLVLLSACRCLDNHLTAVLFFAFLCSKSSHSERCHKKRHWFLYPTLARFSKHR